MCFEKGEWYNLYEERFRGMKEVPRKFLRVRKNDRCSLAIVEKNSLQYATIQETPDGPYYILGGVLPKCEESVKNLLVYFESLRNEIVYR